VVSAGRPGRSLRRLELRVGYAHERPDPDFPSLKILIDGEELLTWAGSRGPYIGPWPGAVLVDDSPLLPAGPPRRIMLYSEGAPDPDEGIITAVIRAASGHVSWTDFRECRGSTARDRDGMVFDLRPAGSTALKLPDLAFDRGQYLAEVRRAIGRREWEADRWKTAGLLDEYLGQAIRDRAGLSDGNLYPEFAEPADDDGSSFLVCFWDNRVRHGIVVKLTADSGTPDERARSMADALMATSRERWPVVRRIERRG
jgi:hypothetical protein